jgi:hypothetical protein
MTSRGLLNVILLLAAAGAAMMVYFHRPDEEPAQRDHALVPIAPGDIRVIDLERVKSPAIRLQRLVDEWHMTLPIKARLDETALARVLDLSRLRAMNRLPAEGLDRYGLDQPWARVRFESHLLEFGNTNTVTEEIYVKSGDAVYAVPARTATAIPGTPGRLIAHRMFAATEVPVSIAMRASSLRHDGTRWQITPPVEGISQDDLIRWIEHWRHASSVTTQPAPTSSTTDVVIELRDGRKIEIGIKTRTPDLVLHRRDEGLDYHFNAGMAAMLLTAPASDAPGKR